MMPSFLVYALMTNRCSHLRDTFLGMWFHLLPCPYVAWGRRIQSNRESAACPVHDIPTVRALPRLAAFDIINAKEK